MMTRTRCNSRARPGGFTLVELMIVVVVVSIIVAIAVPNYTSQIQKARRTDARSALLDLAGREERFLSVSTAYTATATQLGYTAFPQTLVNGYYKIDVTVSAGPPAGFVAKATAINSQANDTTCATMTVDQLGQHKSLDVNSVDTSTTCWAGG
jgi:type IV pilus assembly protein PilE